MNTKIGDNAPPGPIPGPTADEVARVEELTKAANLWLAATERKDAAGRTVRLIDDETTATRAEDFQAQIRAELEALEDGRKAKNEPLRKAIKANDDAYKPLVTRLEAINEIIRALRTAWLRIVQQRQDEARLAAARAAADAQRLADEAARKAREAEHLTIEMVVESESAAETAAAATKAAEAALAAKPQQHGDFTKRAGSLRTFWSAAIDDWSAALAYYADNPKVRAAVQELADADARRLKETMRVPGIRAVGEQRAV